MHYTIPEPINDTTTSPFLKWAGGKRWLIQKHPDLFPKKFRRYIEPFVGSAAVFFHLSPLQGILSDKNTDLIEVYQAIRDDWRAVLAMLVIHQQNHSKDYYYEVRSLHEETPHRRAARFIYLNRTCWNGLYRVNKFGHFNVPIGTKTSVVLEQDNFEAVANMLKRMELMTSDFEAVIDRADNGDFVFVDPPYTVKHNNNGFIKYNESLFSWDDQVRLKDAAIRAVHRGVQVLITNAAHDSVEQLYNDNIFRISRATRHSVLAGNTKDRKPCEELIVCGNLGKMQ